jgi:predicted nucleic acid-binding protein
VSLYVDSSALLKRYVDEPDSDACDAILSSDPTLVTGRHTIVELRRNLARLVEPGELAAVKALVEEDLAAVSIVELDATTCEAAAALAELTGVRTLDALHLGAAQRAGGTALPFVTYDLRQAQAARSLGFTVLGV